MLNTAVPANATTLPALTAIRSKSVRSDTLQLDAWAGAIGRTVADVAALLFVLPMSAHLRAVFVDAIRREVAGELLRLDLPDNEAERIETVAWQAFSRRACASHALPN